MDSAPRPTTDELVGGQEKRSKFRQLFSRGNGSKSGKGSQQQNAPDKAGSTPNHTAQDLTQGHAISPNSPRPSSIAAEPSYYTFSNQVRSESSLPLQGLREVNSESLPASTAQGDLSRMWQGAGMGNVGQGGGFPGPGLQETHYGTHALVNTGTSQSHLGLQQENESAMVVCFPAPNPLAVRAGHLPPSQEPHVHTTQLPGPVLVADSSLTSQEALKSFTQHEALKGGIANTVLTVATVQVTTAVTPDALSPEGERVDYVSGEKLPGRGPMGTGTTEMPPLCNRCDDAVRPWLEKEIHTVNAELEELYSENILEKDKREAAEKSLEVQTQEAAQQAVQIVQQAAKIAELEGEADGLRAMLAQRVTPRQTSSLGVGLLPDMEVRGMWASLGWQIRQLVDSSIQVPGRWWKESSYERLRDLTPAYAAFLRNKDQACLLAEAAIWHVLARFLFASSDKMSWMYWAGKNSVHLRKLADESFRVTEDVKEFHAWRCQTSAFFASVAEKAHVQAHAEELADRVEKMVKHLLAKDGPRARLVKIMALAIELDAGLCQQRAAWFVWYPTAGQADERFNMAFDPDTMEVPRPLEPGSHVALMVSPALLKAGDSRGEQYDSYQYERRSVVVCGPTTPPRDPPPASAGPARLAREMGKSQSKADSRDGGGKRSFISGR